MAEDKKLIGRPPRKPFSRQDLTDEQYEIIMDMATQGFKQADILDAICLDARSFLDLKTNDLLFNKEYMRAQSEGWDRNADKLLTAHTDYADPQVARVFSDNMKWNLSKRKPEIYGDRIEVNLNQTIDIAGTLAEAQKRVERVVTQIPGPQEKLNGEVNRASIFEIPEFEKSEDE